VYFYKVHAEISDTFTAVTIRVYKINLLISVLMKQKAGHLWNNVTR